MNHGRSGEARAASAILCAESQLTGSSVMMAAVPMAIYCDKFQFSVMFHSLEMPTSSVARRRDRLATRDARAAAGDAGNRGPQQYVACRPLTAFEQGVRETGYVEVSMSRRAKFHEVAAPTSRRFRYPTLAAPRALSPPAVTVGSPGDADLVPSIHRFWDAVLTFACG
jgi:hypothetical protein